MQLWRIKYNLTKLRACLEFTLNKKVVRKQYKRVYHVHIRKTAGTSVNSAVWSLGGLDLISIGRSSIAMAKGYVFVRHHIDLINGGCYHYANSHASFWELNLPSHTFSFCVFRDPLQRLISLYKYYYWAEHYPVEAKANDPNYRTLKNYTHWLGDSFEDFLEKLPKQHLMNQLYMFSKNFDIQEAIDNTGKLSKYYFQDELGELESDLSDLFGEEISLKNERTMSKKVEVHISDAALEKAKEILHSEYQFYHLLASKKSKAAVFV